MRRRVKRDEFVAVRTAGQVAAAIGRHPREFVGIVMATVAAFAIFANALFLQKGPHPAPIFATRPYVPPAPAVPQVTAVPSPNRPDAALQGRVQLISDIQRELSRRGFYDGTPDGVWGAKTDAAAREFVQAAGLKINVEANDNLLRAIATSRVKPGRAATTEPVRNDPIAELIAPSKRVLAFQRALAEFGYGPIKITGTYDPETRAAIEKFERDRRLPVTGDMSERVVRELAAMTGRPLE